MAVTSQEYSFSYLSVVSRQQTETWHRALQGTPLQMGIFERQPGSKLLMLH